ncbi:hypothetical protein DPMN_128606 [Dreissena polymorpha]|uniref:Uncharacterized protein n=1 Tax=Dreissena polymorpha TaxID=45954 RepID=A0A9D4GZT4_DREPO|nr:hypothetical protein DPMN_128606 [Dreissena polymorpha]
MSKLTTKRLKLLHTILTSALTLSTALVSGIHGRKPLPTKIEGFKRSAARYVLNDYSYTSSVTLMLQSQEWKTLQYRRSYNSLVMFYKERTQTVAVDQYHLIPTSPTNFTTLS